MIGWYILIAIVVFITLFVAANWRSFTCEHDWKYKSREKYVHGIANRFTGRSMYETTYWEFTYQCKKCGSIKVEAPDKPSFLS